MIPIIIPIKERGGMIPIRIPIKERGFINQGSTLWFGYTTIVMVASDFITPGQLSKPTPQYHFPLR